MALTMPQHDRCPFCASVAGEPSASGTVCVPVFESAVGFVFVDPCPRLPHSLLVVPKRHVGTIFDLTDEEAAALGSDVRRAACALAAAFPSAGMNIYQNNGVAAGQTVGHLHVHLVPRQPDDGGPFRPRGAPLPLEKRLETAERVRRCL